MDFLKTILFVYSIIGLLVSGGLLFNRANKANIFLAIYALLFSLVQLDFLYSSTRLVREFPQFNSIMLPIWLLFGPSLWFYLVSFTKTASVNWRRILPHLIPALIYFGFTIFLFTFSGEERLYYKWQNFGRVIMPLNYGIAIQISAYAIAMIIFTQKNQHNWSGERKIYLRTIVGMYFLTAVLESYLTVYAESYQWFLFYFLMTSSILLFIAYILHFKPDILKQISRKYYSSGLDEEGQKRIAAKINKFLSITDNFVNPKLDLPSFCEVLGEKRHHVSQTIAAELKTTFKDLINKKRVSYAQLLLADKDNEQLKIFAIAIDSGFTNKSTFHRAFVKFTNSTPNEFRKKSLNL